MSKRSIKKEMSEQERAAAASKLQSRLRSVWLTWLLYRAIALPAILSVVLATKPDMIGGMAWQVIWLIPALVLTPWFVKGKSPYALLVGSMLTLVYLGASGVTSFSRLYDSGITVLWAYLLDTVLIFMVNLYLFKLLKRLPSMNGKAS